MLPFLAVVLIQSVQVPHLRLNVESVARASVPIPSTYLSEFARISENGAVAYNPSRPQVGTGAGLETWLPKGGAAIKHITVSQFGKSSQDYALGVQESGGSGVHSGALAVMPNGHVVVLGYTYRVANTGAKRSGVFAIDPKVKGRATSKKIYATADRHVSTAVMDRTGNAVLLESWDFDGKSSSISQIENGSIIRNLGAHQRTAKFHSTSCSGPLLFDSKRNIAVIANPSESGVEGMALYSTKPDRRISHFGPPNGVPRGYQICGINWLPDGAAIVGYANTSVGAGVAKRGMMYKVTFGSKVNWQHVGDYAFRGASRSGGKLLITDSNDKSWLVTVK
ncbi:MAG: hypothetical protein ABIV13_00665 [Fimbriimonadales bacterium]